MCRGSPHLADHRKHGRLSRWRHSRDLAIVLDISWLAFRCSVPLFQPYEAEGVRPVMTVRCCDGHFWQYCRDCHPPILREALRLDRLA